MSSTNKTTHYELSQYIGTDKPTYLGDYNSDMLAIDTAIYNVADNASTAVSTANSAASTASDAATAASAATTTANNAASTANLAKTTAETASSNASAALTAAQGAQTAAAANTITNLAPAYDPTLTYAVGDLVTHVDDQGSGKLYKNIVPIDVPEAFNINKWDDVTTSEVYSKKTIEILFSHDDYANLTDLYIAVRNVILNTPDWNKRKIDVISGYGTEYSTFYHLGAVDYAITNPQLKLFSVLGDSIELSVRCINIRSGNSGQYIYKITASGTTITSTDYSTVPALDVLLSIA